MAAAMRSSMASYAGRRAASRAENFETSRWLSAASGPMRSERPSGKGVKEEGLRGSRA